MAKNQVLATTLIVILLLGSSTAAVYAQQIITPQAQQPNQNLESPLLTNTPEGLNQANNLANFNLSVQDKQSLTEFFNKCPNGIILYKVNGQFFVFCFETPTSGKLFGLHGQPVTIDIQMITKHFESSNGNNNGGGSNDNGNNNNNDNEPDGDCLFNASLPKCDPDENGNCPDDFNLNEDGNCFPDHSDSGCPEGTHGVDDDETGQCYDNDDGCPDGMTLRDNDKSCGYTDEICPDDNNPNCEEETPLAEEEPITCESGSVLENGVCAALDSNCGGEPCTASQKEDSTTSDPILLGETPVTAGEDTEQDPSVTNDDSTDTNDNEVSNDEELEKGAVDEQPENTDTNSNDENDDSNDETESDDTNENEDSGDTNESDESEE